MRGASYERNEWKSTLNQNKRRYDPMQIEEKKRKIKTTLKWLATKTSLSQQHTSWTD